MSKTLLKLVWIKYNKKAEALTCQDGTIFALLTNIKRRNGNESWKLEAYGVSKGFFTKLEGIYLDKNIAIEAAIKIVQLSYYDL